MSKLTRTLIIGATLAAMHLAGMTAVAQAQANDEPVRQPPTERQVGESWRHRQAASQEQTAADAALQRVLARERFSIPNQTPAHVPAPAPPQPTGQPGWLLAALTALSAVLAVVTGLAMVAARRANRRARVGPAT
jgi:Na+(H+)/acetate symporter ActP